MRVRNIVSLLASLLSWPAATTVDAHPMGNFSVSHYSRLTLSAGAIRLDHVLDLAEIPTFQELEAMGATVDRLPGKEELGRWAERRAGELAGGLEIEAGGRRLRWRMLSARAEFAEGAGGLPTLKYYLKAQAPLTAPGPVRFRDLNFAGRAGWKEVVVRETGARLAGAERLVADVSNGLASYPEDRYQAPPQLLEAAFRVLDPAPVTVTPVETQSAAPVAPAPKTELANITRGDFLSQLLSGRDMGWRVVLLALGAAFCLGAFHALSPGHGKTIVAAYLVGSRGTVKHAMFLGGVVTLTHTIGVFALGVAVLLAGPRLVPERMYPWLGVACGLSILGVGLAMFRKRWAALRHHHHHHHHHPHGHSHEIPDKVTLGNLVALGVSGGILPCPSALVVLLAAISLHRAALGVLLIVAFSLGLAVVLSSIGIAMVRARSLFDRLPANGGLVRRLAVLSSAVVAVLGMGIALQALTQIR